MTLPAIVTPQELARHLRVSDDTIRNMINRGEIPEAFRRGPKLWRIHASAVQRLAPKPDTLPKWQDADAPRSEHTNDHPANGASSGEKTGGKSRSAATKPRTKRRTAPTRYVDAFARDFPEYADTSRSAS